MSQHADYHPALPPSTGREGESCYVGDEDQASTTKSLRTLSSNCWGSTGGGGADSSVADVMCVASNYSEGVGGCIRPAGGLSGPDTDLPRRNNGVRDSVPVLGDVSRD